MCYSLLFSTTDERDFCNFESEGFSLSRPSESDAAVVQFLKNPHAWYVHSKYGGCSCHFRYSMEDSDLDPEEPSQSTFMSADEVNKMFGKEVEDEEDAESTRLLYDFLLGLVRADEKVDAVAWWSSDDPGRYRERQVNLAEVGRDRFRFFENTRFEFVEM